MKKALLLTSLLSFFTITSCAKASTKEALVKQITKVYEQKESKKHELLLIGAGSAIPDKIHEFILHFYLYKKIDHVEARKIVVDLVEDLIQMVNQNEKIQEYLINSPFNAKNYQLRIILVDSNNKILEEPYLGQIDVEDGNIVYYFIDKSDINQKKLRTIDETYEEALRKVCEEK